MGLDTNALNLLAFAKNQGADFRRTLSVGRAAVSMRDEDVAAFLRLFGRPDLAGSVQRLTQSKYYEEILSEVFGATEQAAIDASRYEGASIIHDMNRPLDSAQRFTAILDFGCLEHVFNFPVAIHNLIGLCEADGHILHYLPANNCCGHGFYQFSPELFFSLYSADRGFSGTRVFFVEWQDDPSVWFEIRSPAEMRRRVLVANHYEGYLLVITKRLATAVSPLDQPPQQSDYVETWKSDLAGGVERQPGPAVTTAMLRPLKQSIKALVSAVGLESERRRLALRLNFRKTHVRGRRDDVVPVRVRDLVGRP